MRGRGMEMEKGKISVIIPVYNGRPWLEECVESVLVQTFQNFEVLILDDSSTDGTAKLAETLAERDARVRLIRREKQGVSSARNQGIDETDGEYVTFVDADDKIDRRMLEVLLNCLEKEKSDIALCDYIKWSGKNTENSGDDREYCVKTVNKKTYLSDYLLMGNTRCWSVLYRRSAIGKIRFRERLTIGEDMMFLVDMLSNVARVSVTDYKGYFYRINESGAMLRPFTPSYMDEIRSWRFAEHIISWDYPDQKPKVNSILAVSAMLVAGKLAALSKEERSRCRRYVEDCRRTVKEALKVRGAYALLPAGYGIKTALFAAWPDLYLDLYHRWKS